MKTFRVTYDIVTPESAEHGDIAEQGFVSKGCSLRAALAALGYNYCGPGQRGLGFEDGGSSFYTIDPERNYRDGSETFYAVHPPQPITRSSYRRLARLLTGKAK